MTTSVYVGNLAFSARKSDLIAVFEPYGSIEEVRIITDRRTRRPKGFAFVVFANADDAQNALELNEATIKGRAIRVNLAHERQAPAKKSKGGFFGWLKGLFSSK